MITIVENSTLEIINSYSYPQLPYILMIFSALYMFTFVIFLLHLSLTNVIHISKLLFTFVKWI